MNKLLLATLLTTVSLIASDLFIQEGHYSVTYDSMRLPSNEQLGLLGTNYFYDFGNTYVGLGIYSAVSGHRGGFFTGGVEAGYTYPLSRHIYLDGGFFVGGGGGGSAPQGGGLMLRPHVGLLYDIAGYQIGLGVSKVKFPNGDINSNQIYAQFIIPFEDVHKRNTNSPMIIDDLDDFMKNSGKSMGWSNTYFAVTIQRYMIPSGVKNTSGALVTKDMSLIGFEYGKNFNQHLVGFMQTAGAAGGGASGYAEILGGVGYKQPLSRHFGAYARVSLGAAGGGKVDTGGGLIDKESIGLYANLNKKLAFNAEVGHIGAIDGDFKATSIMLGFNYKLKTLTIGDHLQPLDSYQSFGDHEWNIKLSNQRYFGNKNIRKSSTDATSLSLVGLEVDRFLDSHYYMVGAALGAYSGHSGGYAVGLIGMGRRVAIRKNWDLFAKVLLGVAGGGDVSTGGGFIYQPMVGAEYKFSKSFGIQTSFGHVKAFNGTLNTTVLNLGFSYKFRSID